MNNKTTGWMLVLVLGLFAGQQAHAFYNPNAGRWLSRDPLGSSVQTSEIAFLNNSGVNFYDVLGLFKPPVHRDNLAAAFGFASRNLSPMPSTRCLGKMLNTLTEADLGQDSPTGLADNSRHYNRGVVGNETIAQKEAGDTAYGLYIGSEFMTFYSKLMTPTSSDCNQALKALGRITHSWQDFFAHAIRRDGLGGRENSQFPGWGAWTAGVTGNPDERDNFWPSSFDFGGNGEHPTIGEPLINEGLEFQNRYIAARDFVAAKLRSYLGYWNLRCNCWCE